MLERSRGIVICFSVAMAWAICGQNAFAAEADPSLTIPRAIEQLGSNGFEAREEAAAFLWGQGDDALPHLEEASQSTNSLVRSRATRILERVRYGILPTTPLSVAELLHRYRAGDGRERQQAIDELVKLDGYESIIRLIRVEPSPEIKNRLVEISRQFARSQSIRLLVHGREAEAESLLEFGADWSEGMPALATYAAIRGQLPARIARLRESMRVNPTPAQEELLVAFERASGNFVAARVLAEKLFHDAQGMLGAQNDQGDRGRLEAVVNVHRDRLLQILVDQGAWTEAAANARSVHAQEHRDMEQWWQLAAYARRSRDEKAFHEAVHGMRALAEADKESWETRWDFARRLLKLEHFHDALAIVRDTRPSEAFELLVRRGDYDAAIALAKCGPDARFDEAWLRLLPAGENETEAAALFSRRTLALEVARFCNEVGRRDDASAIITLLQEPRLTKNGSGYLEPSLAVFAIQAGFTKQADDLVSEAIANGGEWLIFKGLFGDHCNEAYAWYDVLRARRPPLPPPQIVAIIRDLVVPDPARVGHVEGFDELVATASTLEEPAHGALLDAIVDACRRHGRRDLARGVLVSLDHSKNVQAALRLGDLDREEGDLVTARAWYDRAWRRAHEPQAAADDGPPRGDRPTVPERVNRAAELLPDFAGRAALYLLGVVTPAAEGKRYKDAAILVSLDSAQRHALAALATALADRDLHGDADRIRELVIQTREEERWKAAQHLGNALGGSDPIREAFLWDMLLLETGHFTDVTISLELSFLIHKVRGRGLLEAGKIDDAWREIETCQKILPGDPGLIEAMVPRLEAAGAHEKAEGLFRAGYDRARALSDAWPKAAGLHNNAAWIAACCHRELDEALKRATKAVELDPTNAAYLDTLAEVHFHRGDRAAAIELSRQAIDLAPHEKQFAARVIRFENDPLPTQSQKPR